MKNTPEKNAENFIQGLRHISLTNTEAQAMRERLVAYSNLHTVPERTVGVRTNFFFSYQRMIYASALIVLLLISGTGVSYAAEGTLPGQLLYPVKVAVIEPIQGALITSTAGQAEWQNQLADRRLTEASTLAAENKLATSTQEYLENAVAEHVALSQEDATQLADAGNESAALTVRDDLEARLSKHADFLAMLTPRLAAEGSATTTDAVIALLNEVEQDRSEVQLSNGMNATATSTAELAIATDLETSSAFATTTAERKAVHAALFRLMPGMMVPTSTASTTLWKNASSTEATTTPFRIFLMHRHSIEASSTADLPIEELSLPNP